MSIFSAVKEFSEPEVYKKFPKTGDFFYWNKDRRSPSKFLKQASQEVCINDKVLSVLYRHLVGSGRVAGCCVAGGAAMSAVNPNHPSEDIDVFFYGYGGMDESAEAAYNRVLKSLREDEQSFILSSSNEKHDTFMALEPSNRKVQLIKLWAFDSVDNVIGSFDFRCCQMALVPRVGLCTTDTVPYSLYATPHSLFDLGRKVATLTPAGKACLEEGLEFDIARRARKYQNKGFDVSSVLDDMKIKAFLKANPDVSLDGAQSA